jgi:hypothetical protein
VAGVAILLVGGITPVIFVGVACPSSLGSLRQNSEKADEKVSAAMVPRVLEKPVIVDLALAVVTSDRKHRLDGPKCAKLTL